MAVGDKKPVVMQSDRAVPDGIATLGENGKVPAGQLPVVPVENGGTGGGSLKDARANLSIQDMVHMESGGAAKIRLEQGVTCMLVSADNAHKGCVVLQSTNTGIRTPVELIQPDGWSYVCDGMEVTLAESSIYGGFIHIITLAANWNGQSWEREE